MSTVAIPPPREHPALHRVPAYHVPMLKKLLARGGPLRRLMDRGLLVKTELTPAPADGSGVGVRTYPPALVSHPHEWSAPMLRDAARVIINLALELARNDYLLRDANPASVQFEGARAVWVNPLAIGEYKGLARWEAVDVLQSRALFPLLMMLLGDDAMARRLMQGDGVSSQQLLSAVPARRVNALFPVVAPRAPLWQRALWKADRLFWHRGETDVCESTRRREGMLNELERVRTCIEGFPMPALAPQPRGADQAMQAALDSVLSRLAPQTLLNIGGDARDARLAARSGLVLRLDEQASLSAQIFMQAAAAQLPVTPLVVDVARALNEPDQVNRLACDVVLAMELPRSISPQHLAPLARRALIIARRGPAGAALSDNLDPTTLRSKFASVAQIPVAGGGVLMVCEP